MSNYVKCPCCELNYITAEENCCKVCDPKMRGKLASDAEESYEVQRELKLQEYEAKKRSMEAFYAIRWNRSPRC